MNRKRVQAHELAEKLQVSLRTVYRDVWHTHSPNRGFYIRQILLNPRYRRFKPDTTRPRRTRVTVFNLELDIIRLLSNSREMRRFRLIGLKKRRPTAMRTYCGRNR
ncbi:HTH domain-containing protein [Paenibacillus sp. sptzw28]|uniref:HTH domain-containing protein n=1 Tax=Paenibacillus sp. sptzw28 TaxID=715179 RepID=UPI0037C61ACE